MKELSRLQLRNIGLLSLAWGCAVGCLFLLITNGTGLARQLQGNSKATLPPGIAVACATLASLSAPRFSKHFSKRVLFMLASTSGIVGGGLMCIAGWKRSFPLLCISGAPQGIAYGISNLYRFFAVDTTLPQHREKALAAVVGGAVLSAFIGPEAGRHLRLSLDQEFLGPFVLSMCLWAAQLILISSVDYTVPEKVAAALHEVADSSPAKPALPGVATKEGGVQGHVPARTKDGHIAIAPHPEPPAPPAPARPWHKIALNVDFITGASIACLSFFTMAALMAATPIAMADAGRSIDTSTLVIEAHIVAMYLPSLFSGNLVRRFTPAVMLVPGTLLLLLGSVVLFVSTSTLIFFAALIVIGLGWNFSYVSASSLLLLALKSPLEKPLGQGMFDAIALGGLSVAVITSGFTFDGLGWRHMYTVHMCFNILTSIIGGIYALTRRPTPAKA